MTRRNLLQLLSFATILSATGCGSNPGAWSVEEIETQLKAKIPAAEVKLSGEKGKYTGTAKGTDKTEYKVQVTQDANQGTLNWKAESPQGDEITGSFSQGN